MPATSCLALKNMFCFVICSYFTQLQFDFYDFFSTYSSALFDVNLSFPPVFLYCSTFCLFCYLLIIRFVNFFCDLSFYLFLPSWPTFCFNTIAIYNYFIWHLIMLLLFDKKKYSCFFLIRSSIVLCLSPHDCSKYCGK